MREYEAMIIAKADLPEAELTKLVSKLENLIKADNGQIVKKEPWGIRRLAYPINKQNRGNYFVYDIANTQDNIREFERVLKLDENILRSMITRVADKIDVESRRIELQKLAEVSAQRAAEAARDKAETEAFGARRGRDNE